MKRKIIIIIVSLIICISTSVLIISNIFSGNNKVEIQDDNINKIEEIKQEEQVNIEGDKQEQIKFDDDSNKQESIPEKKEEKQQSTKTNKDTSNTGTKSTTNNKSNNNSNQKSESSDSGVVDASGNSVSENNQVTIDNEPWVKAGVSKEDYYTKPVHSWMRVDYSIENGDCSGVSDCEAKCLKDAEERSFTENLSCIQVMTYSGKYIGEMLKKD